MIVNGEIKEHRIQESMSKCLKGKRVAKRVYQKMFNISVIKSISRLTEIYGCNQLKK